MRQMRMGWTKSMGVWMRTRVVESLFPFTYHTTPIRCTNNFLNILQNNYIEIVRITFLFGFCFFSGSRLAPISNISWPLLDSCACVWPPIFSSSQGEFQSFGGASHKKTFPRHIFFSYLVKKEHFNKGIVEKGQLRWLTILLYWIFHIVEDYP